MNTEQQQRIEQIGRWLMLHVSVNSDPYADLSRAFGELRFLLSIVKEQEADGKFDGPCVSCGHNNYDAKRRECAQRWMEGRMSVVCGCPCAKHNSLDAAVTRMRSLYVEKVKKKAQSYQADADNKSFLPNYRKQMAFAASALREAASELESLTLQEQEPKK